MSHDHPVLDHVVLGAGALFDAKRQAMATRLTVFPQRADQAPDIPGLTALLAQAWPAEAGPLLLNLASESGLRTLAEAAPPPHWLLEVPGFLLSDAALLATLEARVAQGQVLVLVGRAAASLTPAQRAIFRFAVVDAAGAAAALPAGAGGKAMSRLVTGLGSAAAAAAALKAGASAVVGWPLGDAPGPDAKQKSVPAGVQTVVDLMQRVDREESADRLEAVVRTDPSLAFRLMRYLNSPGFGLSVEISSFRHALMILGYQRLKRWLALLVTSAIDDPDLKPLMFLAVRRGLLMEELARPGGDETLRNELFICGVFSLLDRMLAQPFPRLLGSIPVPPAVQQALADDSGPCAPFLAVARAVESESVHEVREAAALLMLAVGDVNRALLRALASERSLTAG